MSDWGGQGTPISTSWTATVQDVIDKIRRMSAMTNVADGSDSDHVQYRTLTDLEIYDCLESAKDDFNIWPPVMTDYTIDSLLTLNSSYEKLLIQGAQIYMLILKEFYSAGMLFNVSDDGHSINFDQFSHHKAIKDQLWQMYEKYLTVRKQHFAMSAFGIRGQFSPLAASPYHAYKGTRSVYYGLYGSTRRNMR